MSVTNLGFQGRDSDWAKLGQVLTRSYMRMMAVTHSQSTEWGHYLGQNPGEKMPGNKEEIRGRSQVPHSTQATEGEMGYRLLALVPGTILLIFGNFATAYLIQLVLIS